MGFRETVLSHREEILATARRHGAANICLFGSVVRGEEDAGRDVDFLVDFEPGRSLLDHVALQQDLEEALGRKVDVVSRRGLRQRVRDRVLREALAL